MLRGHLSAIGQQHDSRVRLLEETDETDKLNGVHQTLLSLSGSRLRLWRHEEKTDISLRFRASASREKNAAIGREIRWWRRRELNPRPKTVVARLLHAFL